MGRECEEDLGGGERVAVGGCGRCTGTPSSSANGSRPIVDTPAAAPGWIVSGREFETREQALEAARLVE